MNYSKEILTLFDSPSNILKKEDKYNTYGISGDINDGEMIKIFLYLENNIVKTAKFKAMGNVMVIATAEKLCSALKDQNIINFDVENFTKYLEIPKYREHNVVKVLEAFYSALQNFKAE